MTSTEDFRFRAADRVLRRSAEALSIMQARAHEGLVAAGLADAQVPQAKFDQELYEETERALALAQEALAELLAADQATGEG